MPIVVKLDVMLAERKVKSKALAEHVGITEANLSLLKQGKVKGVRFDTLEKICEYLDCQPGDLLRYEPQAQAPRNLPMARKARMRRMPVTRTNAVAICALLAAAMPAYTQPFPPIEFVDLFGVRTLDEQAVRDALPFREGDTIEGTEDKAALERNVAEALGVAAVSFALVCCTENRGSILYVGIEERSGAGVTYRPTPTGDLEVPPDVLAANDAFGAALMKAVTSGDAGEDRSQGYSLAHDPAMRAQQEVFLRSARDDPERFARVLRESADARHRAIAATVVGYAAEKAWAARELEAAAFDADGNVRNNAVRALAIIAAYGREHPEAGIEIDYTRFVELLTSLEQTDRNKGLFLLGLGGAAPAPRVLAALEERALPSLIEMCRWRNDGHAEPACFLLAHVVGMPALAEQALAAREQLVAAGRALAAKAP